MRAIRCFEGNMFPSLTSTFSFAALQSTNKASNSYTRKLWWALIVGGPLTILLASERGLIYGALSRGPIYGFTLFLLTVNVMKNFHSAT